MELERRDVLKAVGGIAALSTVGSTTALADFEDECELEEFALQYPAITFTGLANHVTRFLNEVNGLDAQQ